MFYFIRVGTGDPATMTFDFGDGVTLDTQAVRHVPAFFGHPTMRGEARHTYSEGTDWPPPHAHFETEISHENTCDSS